MEEQAANESMDTLAKQAQDELIADTEKTEVDIFGVARWWKRWYLKCGHKRLGRILLKFALEDK